MPGPDKGEGLVWGFQSQAFFIGMSFVVARLDGEQLVERVYPTIDASSIPGGARLWGAIIAPQPCIR